VCSARGVPCGDCAPAQVRLSGARSRASRGDVAPLNVDRNDGAVAHQALGRTDSVPDVLGPVPREPRVLELTDAALVSVPCGLRGCRSPTTGVRRRGLRRRASISPVVWNSAKRPRPSESSPVLLRRNYPFLCDSPHGISVSALKLGRSPAEMIAGMRSVALTAPARRHVRAQRFDPSHRLPLPVSCRRRDRTVPPETIHRLAQDRLHRYAHGARDFGGRPKPRRRRTPRAQVTGASCGELRGSVPRPHRCRTATAL
jgi:hypothetical protein